MPARKQGCSPGDWKIRRLGSRCNAEKKNDILYFGPIIRNKSPVSAPAILLKKRILCLLAPYRASGGPGSAFQRSSSRRAMLGGVPEQAPRRGHGFGRQDARHRRHRFCRRGGRPSPIARGERVVLLARKDLPRGNVEGLDAEIAIGDLRDAASLGPVMRGVDRLYHVAADYRFWARDPNEIIEANRVGVGNIMSEALRAGVSRIVYTSSVGDAEAQCRRRARRRRPRRPRRSRPSAPTRKARPSPKGWSKKWLRNRACRR